MKNLFILLMLILFAGGNAFADYVEEINLEVAVNDNKALIIDCGAGFLEIKGVDRLKSVKVKAEIIIEGLSRKKAKSYIDDYAVLTLDTKRDRIRLISYFENSSHFGSSFFGTKSALINLTVMIPKNIQLDIEDGSGEIIIEDVFSDIEVNDGSGEIIIKNVKGNIHLVDGSGTIELRDISGNIEIDDGSGEINTSRLEGIVNIEDGSGDIIVRDLEGDLRIDDGSGKVEIFEIDGNVIVADGSGDIEIDGVKRNVRIVESGSGDCDISNVDGRISGDID